MPAQAAIELRNLGFAYSGDRWVFRHYNSSVPPGSVCGILGPNGCGKTTLLRVLLGLLPAREGEIGIRGNTAFVPQLFQASFTYSALEMVLMGRARQIGIFSQPGRHDRERALEALNMFGIADVARQPFRSLSGGQRQLTIFARAIVAEADVLILDEPTSALDLRNQDLALGWIVRLAADMRKTILSTTHDPGHAHAVCQQVILMDGRDGGLHGPADTVLSERNLRALYGIDLRLISWEAEGVQRTTLVPVFLEGLRATHVGSGPA